MTAWSMWNLAIFADGDTWIALLTLTGDGDRARHRQHRLHLDPGRQAAARAAAARAPASASALALVMRLGLLFAISWVMGLTRAAASRSCGQAFSGRDLILLGGGLFLVGKATHEIYDKLEVAHDDDADRAGRPARSALDPRADPAARHRVLARLGDHRGRHGAARSRSWSSRWSIAVGVMLVFAGKIGDFVNRHPSMKILALSFLLLIGVMLVAEGIGPAHRARATSTSRWRSRSLVELLNMRFRKKRQRP